MGFDSPVHWLIVIAVIALLFGGSRVGNLMGELGKGIKSFKQNMSDADSAKPAPAAKSEPDVQNRIADSSAPAAEKAPEPADTARH
jgi:sec-independent protein translocase protein TatA